MAKISKISSGKGGSSGGPFTGLFSGFFFGNVVNCDANDKSMYCTLVKIVNTLIMVLVIAFIVYYAYIYLGPYVTRAVRRK
jgi:hypothetical protein